MDIIENLRSHIVGRHAQPYMCEDNIHVTISFRQLAFVGHPKTGRKPIVKEESAGSSLMIGFLPVILKPRRRPVHCFLLRLVFSAALFHDKKALGFNESQGFLLPNVHGGRLCMVITDMLCIEFNDAVRILLFHFFAPCVNLRYQRFRVSFIGS